MEGVLSRPERTEIVFGRAPARGAYDAPPVPLVGWGGEAPSPFSSPQRLRRFGLGASVLAPSAFGLSPSPNSKSWRHQWGKLIKTGH